MKSQHFQEKFTFTEILKNIKTIFYRNFCLSSLHFDEKFQKMPKFASRKNRFEDSRNLSNGFLLKKWFTNGFLKAFHRIFTQRCTVWKFHDFSISQILREINLGDSRRAKSAILTLSEIQNLDFLMFTISGG